MSALIKSCGNCVYLDEYAGDCCHPKGGGCVDYQPALKECLRKDFAWWEQSNKSKREVEQ